MRSDADAVDVGVAGVIIDDVGGFLGDGRRTRVGVLVDVDEAVAFPVEDDLSITVTVELCKVRIAIPVAAAVAAAVSITVAVAFAFSLPHSLQLTQVAIANRCHWHSCCNGCTCLGAGRCRWCGCRRGRCRRRPCRRGR